MFNSIKKTISIALFVVPFPIFLNAQLSLNNFDADSLFSEIMKMENDGDDSSAFVLYSRLHPSDSVFYSAMTSATNSLLKQGRNEEAVSLSDSILRNYPAPLLYRYYYHLNKSVALLRLDRNDEAITCFDSLIDPFPGNYLLYYNKGIGYQNSDKALDAAKSYYTAILLNPYFAESHLKLGAIAYRENKLSQALLCYTMYLLLAPATEDAGYMLNALDHMVSSKNTETEPLGIEMSPDDSFFGEMDLIISNYSALNKAYKIPSKFNSPIGKQLYALLEMLNDFEGKDGFWSQFYVPFFKQLFDEGKADALLSRIHSSSGNKKLHKLAEKTNAKNKDFVDWLAEQLKIRAQSDSMICAYEPIKAAKRWYGNDGRLVAIGNVTKVGSNQGDWLFFHSLGNISAQGSFINGQRSGDWHWFDKSSRLDDEGHFENDSLNGPYIAYYDNGEINYMSHYKKGLLEGKYISYNKRGAVDEISQFTNGVKQDSSLSNYAIGDTCRLYNLFYKDGELEGKAYELYPTGELFRELSFTSGRRDGTEFTYYRNGQLKEEQSFFDDLSHGKYYEYYDDGTLKTEGEMTEGKAVGLWKSFHQNGGVESEWSYNNKGDLDGVYTAFRDQGSVYYKKQYDKGILTEYRYYDSLGTVLSEGELEKSLLSFEAYHENGRIMSKGQFDDNGNMVGQWSFYSQLGVLEAKEYYENGILNGIVEHFHKDGSIELKLNFENGEKVGDYEKYGLGNELIEKGSYKNDELFRINYSYNDGVLLQSDFYDKGLRTGWQMHYSQTGQLIRKEFYDEGFHLQTVYFDTLGKIIDTLIYTGEGLVERKYANGNTYYSGTYINGYAHGDFTYYYSDGALMLDAHYFNSERNGDWTWYYRNGALETKISYDYGKETGTRYDYFEDGTLKAKREYKNGELDGLFEQYSENGNLNYTSLYKQGSRSGIASYYAYNGDFQMQRYYKDGVCLWYVYADEDGNISNKVEWGKNDGVMLAYFPSGDTARYIPMKNGEFHGQFREYHHNGTLAEAEDYYFGYRHGLSVHYYPNGKLKSQGNYRYGEKNGVHKTFYENGQIKSEITYISGERSGKARFFMNDGSKIIDIIYIDDSEYDSI